MVPTSERLLKLRQLMNKHGIQAYFVPSEDAHQSEYTASWDGRRSFISGFTGSAGYAVVTQEKAALWTDGRYFLQAERQLDSNWILMKGGLKDTPTKEEWLGKLLPQGSKVGAASKLISFQASEKMKDELRKKGNLVLELLPNDLIDEIWEDKPLTVYQDINPLPVEFSGKSSTAKIEELQKYLRDNEFGGFLVTALDEVAWLFNLRGSDISFNPLFFSYALITTSDATLYLFKDKLPKSGLGELSAVCVKEYHQVFDDVASFTKSIANEKQKLLVSPSCNAALVMAAGGPEAVVIKSSPVELAKAIKNKTEMEGFRQCHVRDAVALANYFCWLEKELQAGKVIDEVDGADRLEQFRRAQKDCVGLSFDTISGSGPNGAIIHYKPEKPSAANITMDQLYLCDSGGQYLDGTTDVTRTVHFGNPTDEEKDRFTRVLKGNIALNKAVFPIGTTGFMLDILARQYLWATGLDYRHGTGHGVGHYLNVHEGPQNISFRPSANDVPLKPGMTVTDEPGFYEDGKFGIRIENVLLVTEAKTESNFGNIGFLTFENVTMFPIQKKLIDLKLLNKEEIDFINEYHAKVWEKVSPLLGDETKAWLRKETLPL